MNLYQVMKKTNESICGIATYIPDVEFYVNAEMHYEASFYSCFCKCHTVLYSYTADWSTPSRPVGVSGSIIVLYSILYKTFLDWGMSQALLD